MTLLISGLITKQKYDYAVMGKPRLLFLTNGLNRIRITDGVTAWEIGIDAPPAVATYNSQVNGSLSAGDYKFDFSYRRSKHSIIGNGAGASAAMTAGTNPNDGIKINILANSSVQDGIDQVEIYRTLVGGSLFFYDDRADYSGSAITHESIKADSALGAQISTNHGTPLTRPFIESFGNQIHLWGSKTYSDEDVDVTNGSPTVTGNSTAFTKGMVGKLFNRTGDGSKFYFISAVSVAGQTLTLSENYEGTTGTGVDYTISLDPLRSEWSLIDSSANVRPESFPTDNYEEFYGGVDNEKATGIGKTNNQLCLFTNFSVWTQSKVGANTYRKELLLPGVGCINFRTITNDLKTGDIFWQNQNGQIMRSAGVAGSTFNISENFIGNILNGTHEGIHRDLRVDTTKYAQGHALYYGLKDWFMLFQCLSGSTYPNACFVFNAKVNPYGSKDLPSPWVMWTGFTAVSSGLFLDSDGILRPYFGDDLGFIWLMDSGTNDGVNSGTSTGTPTGVTSTILTDSGATFYTTGDGLKGVKLRTYDSNGDLENDVVIQSNTATALTISAWDSTPTTSSVYVIGGIVFERYLKVFNDDIPDKIKKTHNLYLTGKKASSSRNLNIRHYKDFSSTPEIATGQDIDVSLKNSHQVKVTARGNAHQLKFSNKYADEPIEIFNFNREVSIKGKR